MIVALVAVVSVVALVMLSASSTGASMVWVKGDSLGYHFDRPLGHNSADYWEAENSQCYRAADGGMVCGSESAKQ